MPEEDKIGKMPGWSGGVNAPSNTLRDRTHEYADRFERISMENADAQGEYQDDLMQPEESNME